MSLVTADVARVKTILIGSKYIVEKLEGQYVRWSQSLFKNKTWTFWYDFDTVTVSNSFGHSHAVARYCGGTALSHHFLGLNYGSIQIISHSWDIDWCKYYKWSKIWTKNQFVWRVRGDSHGKSGTPWLDRRLSHTGSQPPCRCNDQRGLHGRLEV